MKSVIMIMKSDVVSTLHMDQMFAAQLMKKLAEKSVTRMPCRTFMVECGCARAQKRASASQEKAGELRVCNGVPELSHSARVGREREQPRCIACALSRRAPPERSREQLDRLEPAMRCSVHQWASSGMVIDSVRHRACIDE